jgi:hypothetical protein
MVVETGVAGGRRALLQDPFWSRFRSLIMSFTMKDNIGLSTRFVFLHTTCTHISMFCKTVSSFFRVRSRGVIDIASLYCCGACVAGASIKLAPTDRLSEVILKVILPARQLHDYDNTVPDYLNNHQDVQLPIDSPTQWPLPKELCEFACRLPHARAPILTIYSSKRRKFVAGTIHPFLP